MADPIGGGLRGAGVALALVALSACGTGAPTVPGTGEDPDPIGSPDVNVVVDAAERLQRVDGFGSTSRPLIYGDDDDFLGPYRDAAIQAAYGSVGMSLGLLVNGLVETPVDAVDRRAERRNDNADPLVARLEGFNFTEADKTLEGLVLPARQHGYRDVTIGPLLDLRNRLTWLQEIRDTDYPRYLQEAAEYVEVVVRHWTEIYGLRPTMVHLFNEPTTGNRELVTNSVQEMVDLVAAVGGRLQESGFGDVRLVVPNEETMSRSYQVAEAILADPAARPYVGAIGYHPYPYGSPYASAARILEDSGEGTPDPGARAQMENLRSLGQQYGVPVWLTEVTEGPGNADYPLGSMANVLARAIHIHDNFLYAGGSAFFGMLTLWDSESHAGHFAGRPVPFLTSVSNIVLVDKDAGDVIVSDMGHAIGHYARWVRPGSTRLGATDDSPGVLASAFETASGQEIVVVVINTGPDALAMEIRLQAAAIAGQIRGEVSHPGGRWEGIGPFSPLSSGNALRYELPGRSVATLSFSAG